MGNHDGKISRSEFSNYVMGTNYVRPAAAITTTSNYVKPVTAAVTNAYYPTAPAGVPATSITVQPQATSVFNAIDTNHDGKISRAEFSNYVTGTTSNYVMPAAPVATYSKPAASVATYSNAVAAPSYQYVQPQVQYARAPAVMPATSITVQ